MYYTLLLVHSLLRWFVLISLGMSVFMAARGYKYYRPFATTDNLIRHLTATIAHLQLVVGMVLYSQSPVVKYFFSGASYTLESLFFAAIHIILMLCAIVVITIGSAIAKRAPRDRDKFRNMLMWYGLALLSILTAIPWPFSPLAHRPLLRPF
ncbi:MAG: hypothetical protein EOP56_01095 [Sphingobacteriales bacterium]|nr:MAG: hypothetical protein EOP56_01095 [Sphingobacteriales bacterium]